MLLLLVYLVFFLRIFLPMIGNIPWLQAKEELPASVADAIQYQGGNTGGTQLYHTPTPTEQILLPNLAPSSTPYATQTLTPQATPTYPYHVTMEFEYSYYNPALGGWNCAVWSDEKQDCLSMMANGEHWKDGYGNAIACPPDFALGTKLDVIYPPALIGVWVCKDRGGLIQGKIIDFLDVAQRAPWLSLVVAEVYPPTVPLEEINQGSH